MSDVYSDKMGDRHPMNWAVEDDSTLSYIKACQSSRWSLLDDDHSFLFSLISGNNERQAMPLSYLQEIVLVKFTVRLRVNIELFEYHSREFLSYKL